MESKISLKIEIKVYDNLSELDGAWQKLASLAKEASFRSYSPYSNFNVGAALLLSNGLIVSGNNQENAAYPSGLCAERVAMFHASSQYPDESITRMAIMAQRDKSGQFLPVTPCGGCRQVMSEYEQKFGAPIQVLLIGPESKYYLINDIDSLLPLKFSMNTLVEKP